MRVSKGEGKSPEMLSGARFVASRISWSTRRGYQSGAAGIYGHADPGALERLRSAVFSDICMSLIHLEQCTLMNS